MTRAERVLEIARLQLGVTEAPAGSNCVKYNDWYYGKAVSGSAYPWCMAFVQWCCAEAGAALPFKTVSCGALLRWYCDKQPDCIVAEPKAGDIVIFDFPGGASTDHTGFYVSGTATKITTIDGNTGTGNEANGGAVMQRTRDKSYAAAYIRPRGWEEEMGEKRYQTIAIVKDRAPWAYDTVRKLVECGALKGDGAGLDLSRDMLRMMVVHDRMGLYGEEAAHDT